MGEDGLDLGPVPGLELDDRSSCKCREHGDSQLGSPVLSAGVLHETGWIVWLGVAVLGLLDEVIGRRVGVVGWRWARLPRAPAAPKTPLQQPMRTAKQP